MAEENIPVTLVKDNNFESESVASPRGVPPPPDQKDQKDPPLDGLGATSTDVLQDVTPEEGRTENYVPTRPQTAQSGPRVPSMISCYNNGEELNCYVREDPAPENPPMKEDHPMGEKGVKYQRMITPRGQGRGRVHPNVPASDTTYEYSVNSKEEKGQIDIEGETANKKPDPRYHFNWGPCKCIYNSFMSWWKPHLPSWSFAYARRFFQAVAGEFFAMFFFVFFGVGTIMASSDNTDATLILISLAHGFSITTLILVYGHVSGAHINPAVTLALAIEGKVDLFMAPFYVIAQLLGSLSGATFLYYAVPTSYHGAFGTHALGTDVTASQGVALEAALTMGLCMAVFNAAADGTNGNTQGTGLAAIAIGFTVAIEHFVGVRLTGASMNPGRAFGPAIVSGNWDDHWVYWIGPIIGALLAWPAHKLMRIGEPLPGAV